MIIDIILSFLFIVLLSFWFSLTESGLIAMTPSFVAYYRNQSSTGRLLEKLKDNIQMPLTAILTLNTAINVLGAAFLAKKVYQAYGSYWMSLITLGMTFSILILGEIIPKTLGANYWRQLAPFIALSAQLMVFVTYPVVRLASSLTGKVTQVHDGPSLTREEVIASVELGAEEGSLRRSETRVIRNLLTLNKIHVSAIMTPRSVIFALPKHMTVLEVYKKYSPLRFSRIPVYDGDLDHIVGMVMRYRILECVSQDRDDVKLEELVQTVDFIPERMSVAATLEFFIKKRSHMAIVRNQFNTVLGLVTLEDAIETLLGVEIVDEWDIATDMQQVALEKIQKTAKSGVSQGHKDSD